MRKLWVLNLLFFISDEILLVSEMIRDFLVSILFVNLFVGRILFNCFIWEENILLFDVIIEGFFIEGIGYYIFIFYVDIFLVL